MANLPQTADGAPHENHTIYLGSVLIPHPHNAAIRTRARLFGVGPVGGGLTVTAGQAAQFSHDPGGQGDGVRFGPFFLFHVVNANDSQYSEALR